MELSEDRFEELCIKQSNNTNSEEEEELWFNECLKRDVWRPNISKLTVDNFPNELSFRKFQQKLKFTSK